MKVQLHTYPTLAKVHLCENTVTPPHHLPVDYVPLSSRFSTWATFESGREKLSPWDVRLVCVVIKRWPFIKMLDKHLPST